MERFEFPSFNQAIWTYSIRISNVPPLRAESAPDDGHNRHKLHSF